ncbi:hypothetical protein SAMN05660659_04270 [Pseudomonas sp. LAMO17WK12:I6]|uniref:hypothetical protein n=2 Tax=unclassified Pseudomonas TaxID=196821 RepID=UPI000BD9A178|nr:hypothetical protein [Pseudomonas sp. LAMO17WK12:I5]SNY37578.1 hypothetical protein SAMN05660455_04282 [Pseudomonas sp. LAMO17WK12:I5]SNY39237.1 hypothetical protein SAMN05660659_04270 [Pseudomonas sp. LAMO17WK12:I6]
MSFFLPPLTSPLKLLPPTITAPQELLMEPSSPESKSKRIILTAVVFLLFGAWLYYVGWASKISARTVLMPEIPEWSTYLLIGSITGLTAAIRTLYKRPELKTAIQALNYFTGWFCLGFILSLNGYDTATYLLPGKIISYKSSYELRYPGPSRGKFGRCEAGLWIEDKSTSRWIELCTNKMDLDKNIQQGMQLVWVSARTNRIGSYIMSYTFIYN